MKKLLFAVGLIISFNAIAQSAIDSVKQTVNTLFTAMKTSNKDLLLSAFADSAILQTISTSRQTGSIAIRNEQVTEFAAQIAKLPAGAADERITFDVVKVDADLAIVWTPYKFYFNGNFSHCGVNSFQLVRLSGKWKIQYLIDTRRKDNCVN